MTKQGLSGLISRNKIFSPEVKNETVRRCASCVRWSCIHGAEREIHVAMAQMAGLGKYIFIANSTTENLILDSLYRRAGETDRLWRNSLRLKTKQNQCNLKKTHKDHVRENFIVFKACTAMTTGRLPQNSNLVSLSADLMNRTRRSIHYTLYICSAVPR